LGCGIEHRQWYGYFQQVFDDHRVQQILLALSKVRCISRGFV